MMSESSIFFNYKSFKEESRQSGNISTRIKVKGIMDKAVVRWVHKAEEKKTIFLSGWALFSIIKTVLCGCSRDIY